MNLAKKATTVNTSVYHLGLQGAVYLTDIQCISTWSKELTSIVSPTPWVLLQSVEEWHHSDVIQWHTQPHLSLYVLPLHHEYMTANNSAPCFTGTYTLKHTFLDIWEQKNQKKKRIGNFAKFDTNVFYSLKVFKDKQTHGIHVHFIGGSLQWQLVHWLLQPNDCISLCVTSN